MSSTSYVEVTDAQRVAMESQMGGGWMGYLTRLREVHRPRFGSAMSNLVYRGCTCGRPICPIPRLLLHIEDVRAAYEAKVEDLARETARLSTQEESKA